MKPIVRFNEEDGEEDGDDDEGAPPNTQVLAAMNGEGSLPAAPPGPDGTPGGKICVCHLCHLTFTAYSSLRRHMARHYADRERYECDICYKSYSRKDYLKEHKKLKHNIVVSQS